MTWIECLRKNIASYIKTFDSTVLSKYLITEQHLPAQIFHIVIFCLAKLIDQIFFLLFKYLAECDYDSNTDEKQYKNNGKECHVHYLSF